MALLKDLYSPAFYKTLANALAHVMPSFNKQRFISQIFTDDFTDMELKARMRHTTEVLRGFMPSDFGKAVKVFEKLIVQMRKDGQPDDGLPYIFIPDYIELYGIDEFDLSVAAIETVTQFISCEFAVRPFLVRYGPEFISKMVAWSRHKNEKVRRLSSEGSRPRLPWGMAVAALKADPRPLLPILENLKNDPSESVRRSVSNSLNDIAKDHPDLVISLARKWKGISPETDAIVKHGSRTLLRQGHTEILGHYGLRSNKIRITSFEILTPTVKMGSELDFSFVVCNEDKKKQTIRLEYGVYYRKVNGQLTKKVFKISEKIYAAGAKIQVTRKQSFRKITTRVFYPGKHQLSVIVNGEEKLVSPFEVEN